MTSSIDPSQIHNVPGTVEVPRYFRVAEPTGGKTTMWMIICDEGWRQSIVCSGMYDWAADWLLTILIGRPFAPDFENQKGKDPR